MSSAIESLMFVARISSGKLKSLVHLLETAEPRKVAGLLANIEKEGTVLSQSVQKLSVYADALRQEEASDLPTGPVATDERLLEIVSLLRAAPVLGGCDRCGGVRSPDVNKKDEDIQVNE